MAWRARRPDATDPTTVPSRSNSWAFPVVLILTFLLGISPSAAAQFIRIEAGASDLLPSAGASVNFQGPNYTGYLGVGEIDGMFRLGTSLKTVIHSQVVTLGDQTVAFDLPTDIFNTNHFFPTRGIGINAKEGRANLFFFAGGTALTSGTPFFQAARADMPVGMLFTDVALSPTLHFFSRNVVSRQRTSIQALEWHPGKWLRSGLATGIGSNQPYLAATTDVETSRLSLKAAYISAGNRFRRITASSIYASEVVRENMVAVIKPYSGILLTLGHQNFLQPQSIDPGAAYLHATVNEAQSTFDVRDFRFGAGIFQSTYQNRSNVANSFSASRRITSSLDASVNYFRSFSGATSHVSNLSASLRETISPRISLLQVVNYSQGRTNVLYGGSYLSNRFTVGVDYQTLYLPFRPNPFSQGISVTLRIRLFGSLQVNAQTFRSADGRLRYTASGETVLTGNFRPAGGDGQNAFKHLRYVVRGRVQDETGSPVEGAALLVGEELVITNAAGEFLVRRKTAGILPLQVVFAEFLSPASFRVMAVPRTVTPAPDSTASDITVILARN